MRTQSCVDIVVTALEQALKREHSLYIAMLLLPFWVNAQERGLRDSYRITLPEFPKDTLFVNSDTIPPMPPDSLLLGQNLEHVADSLSAAIIDTLPNGEIRIDYARIPPKVFMLLALKYGPQQRPRRDFKYLDSYFKGITPAMQNPNMSISLGDIIHLLGGSRLSPEERKKRMILQSY